MMPQPTHKCKRGVGAVSLQLDLITIMSGKRRNFLIFFCLAHYCVLTCIARTSTKAPIVIARLGPQISITSIVATAASAGEVPVLPTLTTNPVLTQRENMDSTLVATSSGRGRVEE